MNGRALAAAAATAFQAFLLTASLAGGAYAVDRAAAAETPAQPAFPAPGDTDQAAPGPAGVSGGEDDVQITPASPPAGETEIDPAAAPPGEAGRDPADVTPAIAAPDVPAHPVVAAIRLKLRDSALRAGANPDDLAALEAYYSALSGPPSWITGMGFSAKAQALIAEIEKAGDWGLDPGAFDIPAASELPATAEAQAVAELKLALAALKYARFARGGRLSPARISTLFDQRPELRDPNTVLVELAQASDPGLNLRALHPKNEQFEGLRQALVKAIAKAKARGSKPEEMRDRVAAELQRWSRVMQEAGIKPQ